jgi:hypothetical protein
VAALFQVVWFVGLFFYFIVYVLNSPPPPGPQYAAIVKILFWLLLSWPTITALVLGFYSVKLAGINRRNILGVSGLVLPFIGAGFYVYHVLTG